MHFLPNREQTVLCEIPINRLML